MTMSATAPQDLLRATRASLIILDRRLPFEPAPLARAGVLAVLLSDNARLDFIKWKIVLIAALAAAGLGLASEKLPAAPAVLGLIAKRLLLAIPNLIGVVIITFLLTRALPGDPAAYFAGPAANKEAIRGLSRECHDTSKLRTVHYLHYSTGC